MSMIVLLNIEKNLLNFLSKTVFILLKVTKSFSPKMKILFLIALVFSLGLAQQLLPCFTCSADYEPVCGQSIHGDKPKTFQNFCEMKAQDCGYSKEQYVLLYEGHCKKN
ncbi:unnamed protein product [Chironomus riparius]|uniref:Kazal-like domain-containing protein n=1 Tax=Chironomus riparius TaxID=315576 RepID=A0A9N9WXK5_9DIPT|nr:unnamed protein product [Chironomus riparius]